MKIIAVDIGNSAIKLGWLNGNRIEDLRIQDLGELNQLRCFGSDHFFWSVCSVSGSHTDSVHAWVRRNRPQDYFHVISHLDINLPSNNIEIQQVGKDRLVAAYYAIKCLNQGHGVTIVDAGTALTIDHVDENSMFCGGIITLGAKSSLKSLATLTDALPDLSESQIEIDEILHCPLGSNTRTAMLRGVYRSQIATITAIVNEISNEHCRVMCTGGGINILRDHLPKTWEFDVSIVLRGAFEVGKELAKDR